MYIKVLTVKKNSFQEINNTVNNNMMETFKTKFQTCMANKTTEKNDLKMMNRFEVIDDFVWLCKMM